MSRLGAGIGGGLGAVAGSIAGHYGGRALRRGQFGYTVSIDPRYAELGGAVVGGLIGAAVGAGPTPTPKQVGTSGLGALPGGTPAQAAGHPNFVTDVPTQGPTDPTMRTADCRFVQTRIPTQRGCADCEGPIPMWAKQNLSSGGRGNYSGIGERVSFGGVGAPGFALAGPDVFAGLTAAQKQWVVDALVKIDAKIRETTKTTCPTFGPSVTAAGGCFQGWFNGAGLGLTRPDGSPVVLRTDGVFDQDTLDALRTVAALHPTTFTTPFPGTQMAGTGGEKKGLSTGAMVGIAAGAVAVIGGTAWVLTRKKRS